MNITLDQSYFLKSTELEANKLKISSTKNITNISVPRRMTPNEHLENMNLQRGKNFEKLEPNMLKISSVENLTNDAVQRRVTPNEMGE